MDFGGGVPWRQPCLSLPPHPHRFASFHTCIHEKFMTVLSVSHAPHPLSYPPPPNTTLLAQSIHLETDFQRGCNREETKGGGDLALELGGNA